MRSLRHGLGLVLGLFLMMGSTCEGQSGGGRGSLVPDLTARVMFTGGKPSVEPAVAIVSSKSGEFQWVVDSLPKGYTVEIDFRVHDGAKGPFKAKKASTGRYTGASGERIGAGEIVNKGRNGWKYDLVIRDAEGNDQGAIDPMVIVAE